MYSKQFAIPLRLKENPIIFPCDIYILNQSTILAQDQFATSFSNRIKDKEMQLLAMGDGLSILFDPTTEESQKFVF